MEQSNTLSKVRQMKVVIDDEFVKTDVGNTHKALKGIGYG